MKKLGHFWNWFCLIYAIKVPFAHWGSFDQPKNADDQNGLFYCIEVCLPLSTKKLGHFVTVYFDLKRSCFVHLSGFDKPKIVWWSKQLILLPLAVASSFNEKARPFRNYLFCLKKSCFAHLAVLKKPKMYKVQTVYTIAFRSAFLFQRKS